MQRKVKSFKIIPILQISSTDGNEVELESPINLMNLPAELRLTIFERLDFEDLIRVSQALPQDRKLIERLIRSMFKNHTFRIYYDENYRQNRISYDESKGGCFELGYMKESFDEILEFFQFFGHCITKLEISYIASPDRELRESLHKQIRAYVAKFVNAVYFCLDHSSINSSLNGLIVPFPNAKDVELRDTEIDAATLHHMFPAVRSLNLRLIRLNGNLKYFSHLERLAIPTNWGGNKSNLPLFKQTLELNPQIKHLTISGSHQWGIMKMVNKIRPDLDSLEFFDHIFDGHEEPVFEPLHFANMKVLKCKVDWFHMYGRGHGGIHHLPLEFGNLEEIEFDREDLVDYWVNIMMQNRKLRKISSSSRLRYDTLAQIVGGLPNLEDFMMEYDAEGQNSVQRVVDFLRSAKQLKKVTFIKFGSNECSATAQVLINEWKNVKNGWFCCFVRN